VNARGEPSPLAYFQINWLLRCRGVPWRPTCQPMSDINARHVRVFSSLNERARGSAVASSVMWRAEGPHVEVAFVPSPTGTGLLFLRVIKFVVCVTCRGIPPL
jgi:hypothetical protein